MKSVGDDALIVPSVRCLNGMLRVDEGIDPYGFS